MNKKIAPIIITVIAVDYMFLWGTIPFAGDMGMAGFIFMLVATVFICVLIANLLKRMREIDEEDEDDIRRY